MFKRLFGGNKNSSKTGYFKIENDELVGINERPGDGSINNCIESLGFARNHIHTVFTFDSDKIQILGFKIFSRQLVFALAKTVDTKLSFADVLRAMNEINWVREYSSRDVDEMLQEGISAGNLDLKLLQSVTDLKEEGENLYKAEKLNVYLQFENGTLVAFTSSDLRSADTKYLASLNEPLVHRMTDEARLYHKNDVDSMEEVNKQCSSLLGIPEAVNNPFISIHTKTNGNVSFYNLLVTHYDNNPCSLEEFLFMNKGRFRKINDITYDVGNFIYSFDTLGYLESAVGK